MSKKLLLIMLTIALVGISLVSVKPAQAFWPFDLFKKDPKQETQTGQTFPHLIQKLIDKFNLNPDEVRETMEEAREERQAEHQEQVEERLNKAVEEGKITEEQKQAILAKKEEIKARLGELKDLSPEERQEKMKEYREEMRAWSEENGIGLKRFFGLSGRRGRHFGPWLGK